MNKEIKIAGRKIFYRVHGDGKPVMLVHGFGETGDVWYNQASLNLLHGRDRLSEGGTLRTSQKQFADNSLQNSFMFIVPDLPGSGKSEMIDDMSIEGMAEVLKIILDKESLSKPSQREGLPNTQGQLVEDSSQNESIKTSESSQVLPLGEDLGGAFLIGHSMGGYITLAFAEKYESYLSAFGLFHSTAFPDIEEKKAIRRKGIEFIKAHGAFEFLKTSTPNLFSQPSKDEFPQLIDKFIQGLNNFSVESLVSYYEAMIKRPDRVHVLKDTRVPVLFIAGEYDNAVPLQEVLKQCHLPEKSYFHVLHHSGHLGMLEETGKSNRLLEEFLDVI